MNTNSALCRPVMSRHDWILACLLSGGLFVFYFAMRPLSIHVSDSYAWVNTVEQNGFGYFLHPHHILYVPLAWRWNAIVEYLLPGTSTWASLAALSALSGSAGAAAVFATARSLGAGRPGAVGGSLLVAAGFGYWFFSSAPEVYILSLASALWCFYFITLVCRTGRARFAVWAGVSAGFAALFHQTGIFLFVPAVVVFSVGSKGRGVARKLGLFTLSFGLVVAPAYIGAAWAVLPELSVGGFVRWIFLFAGKGHGGLELARAAHAPLGLLRAVVGGQAAIDVLRGVQSAGALLWAGLAAGCAAVIAAQVLVAAAIRRFKGLERNIRVLLLALTASIATYSVFSIYFDPGNFEWWTIPASLAAFAVVVSVACSPAPRTATIFVVALALFTANFSLDFLYRRDPDNDFLARSASSVVNATTGRDVIIAPSYFGVLIWHVEPLRDVVCPDEAVRAPGATSREVLRDAAERALGRGGRIVLAGADRDPATVALVGPFLAGISEDERITIESILFFDGKRRLVRSVSDVPLAALDPVAVMEVVDPMRFALMRTGKQW